MKKMIQRNLMKRTREGEGLHVLETDNFLEILNMFSQE
jgi:hypothetical protein